MSYCQLFSHENDRMSKNRRLHCNYIGHLESEPDACIGMTGCPGVDNVEVAVYSKRLGKSNTFFWRQDGTVEVLKFDQVRLLTCRAVIW